ncbi:vacuolar iron transporter5-like [Dorcoceras hygrometricum]|uniref:Vacuolar iron transporter n=1 Tax=Dorcoceras hygrometricum TaxID=472368 RepID=A0A2Z7C5J6_9LAMI|nr:vacuolar iron transporter5-like [Dorcoceras hygrometricum]
MESSVEIKQPIPELRKVEFLQRAQWLRAAILGANDGLLSTTSLMIGVTAAKDHDQWLVIVSGLAGALAGACSMAVGEFASVSTQRDIEQNATTKKPDSDQADEVSKNVDIIDTSVATPRSPFMKVISSHDHSHAFLEETLPNPYKAAGASAIAFLCGSAFPLMAAIAVSQSTIRVVAIAVVSSVSLAVFGAVGAYLGGSSVRISAVRVLVGGWISMGVTYGLLKPIDKQHEAGRD